MTIIASITTLTAIGTVCYCFITQSRERLVERKKLIQDGRLKSFSDEFLLKLQVYLCKNAKELARKNKICQIPYYRNDPSLRRYQWTIVNLEEVELGNVELYFTAISNILIIKGIDIESSKVKEGSVSV